MRRLAKRRTNVSFSGIESALGTSDLSGEGFYLRLHLLVWPVRGRSRPLRRRRNCEAPAPEVDDSHGDSQLEC